MQGTMADNQLYGLVDMGSNGIRFSITDLSPTTARALPTVFQERLGLSLYDAQYSTGSKGPIPQDITDQLVSSLRRFKAVCADFLVPENNIKVLATEATRTAINSEHFRNQIQDVTGWTVNMLPKETEGRVGAFGIASSFDTVDGLVMDLGGGSTQITWMQSTNGEVKTSPKGSFSFPYGAAALSLQLTAFDSQPQPDKARAELRSKMRTQFLDAYSNLELPPSLIDGAKRHGLTLYLSGGGFRGWGYLLMSKHKIKPYPIPIINGFSVPVRDFEETDHLQALAEEHANVFRVSKRRASQVPAVAFLVSTLVDALPFIKEVRFCQGGVREGFLFDTLPAEIRATSPVTACTLRHVSDHSSSLQIATLLASALPDNSDVFDRVLPVSFDPPLLQALANTMYVQASSIKESASVSALYLPITGVLSSAHGVSHTDRALLSLMLCQRWGGEGDLPVPHENLHHRLQGLLTQQEVWWAFYLGTVAGLIGDVYPAGRVPSSAGTTPTTTSPRIQSSARWSDGLGKKANQQGISLKISLDRTLRGGILSEDILIGHIERIEDMGKKKNRVGPGGREYGFGIPVQVELEWV